MSRAKDTSLSPRPTRRERTRPLTSIWSMPKSSSPLRYLTAERLAKAKNLKLAITAGIGSDHVDLNAANKTNGGVTVAEVTGSNVVSVAEHVVMTILNLVRNYTPSREMIGRGDWDVAAVAKNEYDLEDKTVGTVAVGRIGERVLRRLKPFDCKELLYFDYQPLKPELEKEIGCRRVDKLEDMLAQCDVVTINCPLHEGTRGLFNAEMINKMKKGSWLVNTARGAIVVKEDVAAALKSGQLRGYGGDVWFPQPAPKEHPLRYAQYMDSAANGGNATVPHMSGSSIDAQARYAKGTKDILESYFTGKEDYRPTDLIVHKGDYATKAYGQRKAALPDIEYYTSGKADKIAPAELTASLASLNNIAWFRLDDTEVRLTVIPERGTQGSPSTICENGNDPEDLTADNAGSVLAIDSLFQTYTLQSAAPSNAINLEVPLPPLLRALRPISNPSTSSTSEASIRLTKKDGQPSLCVTLLVRSFARPGQLPEGGGTTTTDALDAAFPAGGGGRERETQVTLDVPVRVLPPERVAGLHEPTCRDTDVHIMLPPLAQVKAISERFTKLALASSSSSSGLSRGNGTSNSRPNEPGGASKPRLTLSATMHGHLRLSLKTDTLSIASTWRNLHNPSLDPSEVEGGEAGIENAASTRMRNTIPVVDVEAGGGGDLEDLEDQGVLERGWARVRLDARDWGRVLSVGRLGGRVVACFCNGFALVLYVYLGGEDGVGVGGGGGGGGGESVLTVSLLDACLPACLPAYLLVYSTRFLLRFPRQDGESLV
ncbi:MAG: formate dehydrogenase (NAD+) [Chrysothrix sp. TS-e1954]|nr:MAG: formate dehydrogenase (NAD+) [Chrysothrix sp. TS-e1954]